MNLYRIARGKYIGDLSGNGGLVSSARWHNHIPVVYASINSSTCILEKFVHLLPDEIHNDLMIATIMVPDTLESEMIRREQLPANWKDYPGPDMLKRIGNAWLRAKTSALLFVPSVIDPLAQNVLINPLHADAAQIKVSEIIFYQFDERLFRG